ncbi:MAG: DUF4340 domain-containing protein [Candidatus Sumerlaeia bacterium]
MKPQKLIVLLIVAIVIIGAAIIAYKKQYATGPRKNEDGIEVGNALLPDLEEKVGKIHTLVYQSDDGSSISLKRTDADEWVIASLQDYPANPAKINQLVFGLTDMKVANALTDNPEKYENFGLSKDSGEKGTLIFKNEKGDALATLRFGKEREGSGDPMSMGGRSGGGRYFLVNDDPHVYLAEENLYWLNGRTRTWVDAEIMSVPREDIVAVEIDHGSTESLSLVGDNGNSLQLENLKEGYEQKRSAISSVAGALASLRLEDVLPANTNKLQPEDFGVKYQAQSKDGTLYYLQAGSDNGDNYIMIRAKYTEPHFTDADKATTESLASAEEAAQEAQSQVAAFNARHEPWIYQISSWNYGNLTKERSDLMEKKEEEGADSPEAEE